MKPYISIFFVFSLWFPLPALAMSCSEPNMETIYNTHPHIFLGTVKEVKDGKIAFDIKESYRGKEEKLITAYDPCSKPKAMCPVGGGMLQVGKDYLIFGRESETGEIRVDTASCTPNRQAEFLKDEIDRLRIAKKYDRFPLPKCSSQSFFMVLEEAENVFYGDIIGFTEFNEPLDINGTAFDGTVKVKVKEAWKGGIKPNQTINVLVRAKSLYGGPSYKRIQMGIDQPRMEGRNAQALFLTKVITDTQGKNQQSVFDCHGFITNPSRMPFPEYAWAATNYIDQTKIYFGEPVPECKKSTDLERVFYPYKNPELARCIIESAQRMKISSDWYNAQLFPVLRTNFKEIDNAVILEMLLKNKANPDFRDENGITPLHQAILTSTHSFNDNSVKLVSLLLAYGANPTLESAGKKPIYYAYQALKDIERMQDGTISTGMSFSEDTASYKTRNIRNAQQIIQMLKKEKL